MNRYLLSQRPDYIEQLEGIGMNYWNLPSGPDNLPYWAEGVTYALSESEVDRIQEATQELHNMSIDMCSRVIKSGDYPEYFKLTELDKSLIEQSWKRGDRSLYGRFDLALGTDDSLKMFEYNGDTPVSILEASVAQWDYIRTCPDIQEEFKTQYNLIDETLLETWTKFYKPKSIIHFAAGGDFRHEDWGNLVYLMDTAYRAGMTVKDIKMEDIGLTDNGCFVDLENIEMRNVFKLYPWEWMTAEGNSTGLKDSTTRFMEPAWKMLLSNKAMLVKLWELNKGHPNLLESYAGQPTGAGTWARKAIHGREGSNIFKTTTNQAGAILTDELGQGSHVVKEYDQWGYMYQEWFNVKQFDGYYPIFGSWVIGDKACGMSIREDLNPVTGHNAFFASHFFVPAELESQYLEVYK